MNDKSTHTEMDTRQVLLLQLNRRLDVIETNSNQTNIFIQNKITETWDRIENQM